MIFQWNSSWFFSALLCVFNRLIAREKFRRSSNDAPSPYCCCRFCVFQPRCGPPMEPSCKSWRSATPRGFTISNRRTVATGESSCEHKFGFKSGRSQCAFNLQSELIHLRFVIDGGYARPARSRPNSHRHFDRVARFLAHGRRRAERLLRQARTRDRARLRSPARSRPTRCFPTISTTRSVPDREYRERSKDCRSN